MDQLPAVTNTAAKVCVSFFIPMTRIFLRTLLPRELGKVKKKPTVRSRVLPNCTVSSVVKEFPALQCKLKVSHHAH